MSEEHFLTIPSIPGDVKDDRHRDAIHVLTWNWAVSNTPSGGGGGGGGHAGKAQISDLAAVLLFDSATPRLFEACARGKRFDEVMLSIRREPDVEDYLTLKMTDAVVSSISNSHSGGDPVVQITLGFESVTMTHRTQRADGALAEPVVVTIGRRV